MIKENPFTEEQLVSWGYTSWRVLENGSVMAVGPMAHNNGRLFMDVNPYGYEHCYCYDSLEAATESMNNFNEHTDKEPEGWKRDPMTGRRRPNNDKTKEYISF